ncbi:MAG: hypothetical protein WC792_01860 [Candidatus Micrarchaeia archaeon]
MELIQALELATAALSAAIVALTILTLVAYYQQVGIGAERREKNFTILASLGMIALSTSEILRALSPAGGNELEGQLLKTAGYALLAFGFYAHFKKYAGRYLNKEGEVSFDNAGLHPTQIGKPAAEKKSRRAKR